MHLSLPTNCCNRLYQKTIDVKNWTGNALSYLANKIVALVKNCFSVLTKDRFIGCCQQVKDSIGQHPRMAKVTLGLALLSGTVYCVNKLNKRLGCAQCTSSSHSESPSPRSSPVPAFVATDSSDVSGDDSKE